MEFQTVDLEECQVFSWQNDKAIILIKTCWIISFMGSQFSIKSLVNTSMRFKVLHPVTENIDNYGETNSKLNRILYKIKWSNNG